MKQWAVDRLAALAPAEYDAYQRALAAHSEIDAARTAIQLARKARELADKSAEWDFTTTAWEQCLKQLKNAQSKEAQQLILDEWNNDLARDDTRLPSELDAAAEFFDRRLLSAGFWKLLEAPKKLASMSAACSLLLSNGDQDDANCLDKVVNAMAESDERRPHILCLIEHLRARLSGHEREIQSVPNWLKYRSETRPVPL